jgi:hypothetical protein
MSQNPDAVILTVKKTMRIKKVMPLFSSYPIATDVG